MNRKPQPYDPTRHTTRPFQPCESRDLLRFGEAARLAEEMTDWWHERGYPYARFWVEGGSTRAHGHIAVVRSNLVNGVPPRKPDVPFVQPVVDLTELPQQSAQQVWHDLAMPRSKASYDAVLCELGKRPLKAVA